MSLPACPKCQSEFTYNDGIQLVCPECAHEWLPSEETAEAEEEGLQVFDAHGTKLADGDDVVLIKDLRVKAAPPSLNKARECDRFVYKQVIITLPVVSMVKQ